VELAARLLREQDLISALHTMTGFGPMSRSDGSLSADDTDAVMW